MQPIYKCRISKSSDVARPLDEKKKNRIEHAKLIFGYHYRRTPLFQSPRGNGKSSK